MLRNHSRLRSTTALLALVALGCGGGGGGGDGGGGPAPTPRPTPTVPAGPTPTPQPPAGSARIILQNGDVSSDGVVVGNIEDAALARNGNLSVIVARDSGSGDHIVLEAGPDRQFEVLFDETNAPADVDLGTLTRLRMAPTGEIAFLSGTGLDTDKLHYAADGEVRTIAGGPPGVVKPDFRVLGNFRIVSGGIVAFTGGAEDCVQETTGDTVRNRCTLALYLADRTQVVRIEHEGFLLEERLANDAQIAINESGDAYFSLPGRRESPMLIRYADGEVEALLQRESELPGLGLLSRIDVVDLDEQGRLLVELGLVPENEDDPILDHVGLLDGDRLETFAREGTIENGLVLERVRGIGLGGGAALFEVTLRDPATDEAKLCLRLGNAEEVVDVVCEGDPFAGGTNVVFTIEGARINAVGDVLFVSQLGRRNDDTTFLEETRATVRRIDGEYVTIASSKDSGILGAVTALNSVGFDDSGNVLLIAERDATNDRVLLIGGSR